MVNTPKIDEIDLRILRALRADGRMSAADLSQRVGLSATPVIRRLRQLEESGVITGYAALIDEVALGFALSIFVSVKLDRQVDVALRSFEAAILRFPEVVDCWLMTGNRDYLLRIAVTGLKEFETLMIERLVKIDGVASIESSIPLRRIKSGISRTP
ncbi:MULTISPECIES: Lrp/AsnC family transcriptional regulator [Aurantimonas]|uniref:Lrp/AsnC family transcriptional regulator n=1 Tax=Aurantimonas TaxID=182269 RepID=UPI0016520EC1|nr:Lrp/AsnC family transcriptional regulator [Aurantimonas coralicida]MBC6715432.1 Lrp/AsnC family transcriptional regulator [Aurantimonas sp. DM33-3]MCD1644402.1 Lrp/AsnC family transcriptional regulator [Aurantimonas coralicida]MCW7544624.1 Lrp/AsnC family transcriptional regulator [Aurantimonas litoralis]